MNCGKLGAHFVTPAMGDDGFFACESMAAIEEII